MSQEQRQNDNVDLVDLEETKEYKKAKKVFANEKMLKEFLDKTDDELERVIVDGHMHIREITDKTKNNTEYAKAKLILKDFANAIKDRTKDTKTALDLANRLLYMRKEGAKNK